MSRCERKTSRWLKSQLGSSKRTALKGSGLQPYCQPEFAARPKIVPFKAVARPFLPRSRPWLLTTAAGGGLVPAPASRFRGAYPHQLSSYALLGLAAFRAHGARWSANRKLSRKDLCSAKTPSDLTPFKFPWPNSGKSLLKVVITQKASVIVGLQPVVKVNVVQIGRYQFFAEFVSFRK